jgi:hypothetical protein
MSLVESFYTAPAGSVQLHAPHLTHERQRPSLPSIKFLLNDPATPQPPSAYSGAPSPASWSRNPFNSTSQIGPIVHHDFAQAQTPSTPLASIPYPSFQHAQPKLDLSKFQFIGRHPLDVDTSASLLTPTSHSPHRTTFSSSHAHHHKHHLHQHLARSLSDQVHPYAPPRTSPPPYLLEFMAHRSSSSTNTTFPLEVSSTIPVCGRNASVSHSPSSPSSPLTDRSSTCSDPSDSEDHVYAADTDRSMSPSPEHGDTHKECVVSRSTNTGTYVRAYRYACPFCAKKFTRPSSLRVHTYSHTGERPFECPEPGCGRQFSVQSNMRRHLRVHRLGRVRVTKKERYEMVRRVMG